MKKFILYIIIGAATVMMGYTINNMYSPDLSPVQPIPFSHKIHAGANKIPCMYCHIYAENSRHAGVPNVKRCMGCHSIIRTDSPLIQKLASYWEKKEPIPWVKVYNLPDHVYFPHKRHVKAGVPCQRCHGDVATMDRITRQTVSFGIPYARVSPLKMGWCIECHNNEAQKYIGTPVKNGTDCWTCHK